MTITRTNSEGKPITINVRTWQFVASILGIVVASLALATPWTQYTAKNAVAPRLESIESQLKSASERAVIVEERLNMKKDSDAQQDITTEKRLDRIEQKLDRLLERQK